MLLPCGHVPFGTSPTDPSGFHGRQSAALVRPFDPFPVGALFPKRRTRDPADRGFRIIPRRLTKAGGLPGSGGSNPVDEGGAGTVTSVSPRTGEEVWSSVGSQGLEPREQASTDSALARPRLLRRRFRRTIERIGVNRRTECLRLGRARWQQIDLKPREALSGGVPPDRDGHGGAGAQAVRAWDRRGAPSFRWCAACRRLRL